MYTALMQHFLLSAERENYASIFVCFNINFTGNALQRFESLSGEFPFSVPKYWEFISLGLFHLLVKARKGPLEWPVLSCLSQCGTAIFVISPI